MSEENAAPTLPFTLEDYDPEVDELSIELVETAPSTVDRSLVRRATLQILYEMDSSTHAPDLAIAAHLAERNEVQSIRKLIRRYVNGIVANRARIDAILQEHAPQWPIDQVATIDRNILRIAVFEFLLQKRHTPDPVIVNEAVHLAQVFGANSSHSFVHGVLSAILMQEPAATKLDKGASAE